MSCKFNLKHHKQLSGGKVIQESTDGGVSVNKVDLCFGYMQNVGG